MTATRTRDEELAALRRPFLVGVVLVLLVVAALGVVIARFGSTGDRPAGIAERWLVAVGDTTRRGVEGDARERIAELSVAGEEDPTVEQLLALAPEAAADERAAFETVRVGLPLTGGDAEDATSVPAVVTPYEGDALDLYVVVERTGDGWRVRSASPAADVDCGGECPGFPVQRPERAPLGWFVGALALGVVITLGCVAAVRAATPKPG